MRSSGNIHPERNLGHRPLASLALPDQRHVVLMKGLIPVAAAAYDIWTARRAGAQTG
ncbi:hypothetical protein [Amycolatopsis sp.]|uniref:hypothetical protein n=1 Tax=Amycolatopsis sp. TaxID=37632 RepID=UPI002604282C|nr:hypothetical protein [Amycolatopsis sp.]